MFLDPNLLEATRILRKKYDTLRKGIEKIATDHSNSTAGLDSDDMAIRLLNLLKKDNKLQFPKGVEQ